MNEDPDDHSLWPALLGFLVFCLLVGLLFGRVAYGLVQQVVGGVGP